MGSRLEAKSSEVRKRIENHTFHGEDGEEYEGSKFGGFSDYFRRKKQKLQNLDAQIRAEATNKPPIFRGVVCHVNGYTQPSLNDLHTMIVQHSGGFLQYLDGKTMVTHIIASNLTPKKREEFKRYRIVKPAWVVDSVKAGKLLPWNEYRVLDEGVAQRVLGFDNGQVVSQASKRTQGYREQTDASWYTSQLKSTATNTEAKGKAAFRSTSPIAEPSAEDIEDDDEFDLPEITSSVEEALREADRSHSDHKSDDVVQTSPPTSPPAVAKAIKEREVQADDNHQSIDGETQQRDSEAKPAQKSALLPRQGSQEPSYTHSLIRDSAILKSIPQAELAAMTAEQHNALLLSDPKIRASTVVNPAFLEQYYRESRLHHLSTWKADLKSQLQALAAQASSSQKATVKRPAGSRRYVMHVDFDSFFAAISLKKCPPEWKELPAAVAHGGGSGSEIASCNYPAREHGVKNGMWMKRAQEMCPDLKVLPYDFPAYEDASRAFYAAILNLGGIVQSVSIDEALVDISSLCAAEDDGEGKADELGNRVRTEVLEKTGCAVSVGIGGNILLAKLALRKAKPAGQFQLKPDDVLDFIGELEVQRLPGVAGSTGAKLEGIGVKLIRDLRAVSKEMLCRTLGPKQGAKFYDYARGIDKTEVGDSVVRKSVSAEVNWGVRFETHEQVDEFMHGLCGELNRRLVKEGVKGSLVTVKVMRRAKDAPLDPPKHLGHGKCDVFNKSKALGVATHDPVILAKEAIAMLKSFGISPGELRGIGVQMQKLEPFKLGGAGVGHGSQRRLHFNAGPAPGKTAEDDAIQDDGKTPEKARFLDVNRPSAALKPVETPITPSKKPLNMMGTQFIMPTQVDPAVLAELPMDIRARLAKQTATKAKGALFGGGATKSNRSTTPPAFAESQFVIPTQVDSVVLAALPAEIRARLTRPNKADPPNVAEKVASSASHKSPATFLPTHSQIDPTILSALPEDVRNEIRQHYNIASTPVAHAPRRPEQALLPQSPRKNRTLPPAPRPVAKRGRGRPRGSLNVNRSLRESSSTLTQSNFIARSAGQATVEEDETIDPEVLAQLPEDLKQEILAQQRQARLQRTGGIDTSLFQQRGAKAKAAAVAAASATLEKHVVRLPPKARKPEFTSGGLKELGQLRAAISAWFREFEDEGPHEDDVSSLGTYLKAVVGDERDLEKAVKIVAWLEWVVKEAEGAEEWQEAVGVLREAVKCAAKERGMGSVRFE